MRVSRLISSAIGATARDEIRTATHMNAIALGVTSLKPQSLPIVALLFCRSCPYRIPRRSCWVVISLGRGFASGKKKLYPRELLVAEAQRPIFVDDELRIEEWRKWHILLGDGVPVQDFPVGRIACSLEMLRVAKQAEIHRKVRKALREVILRLQKEL